MAVLGENMTDEENPVTKARSSYEFIPGSKGQILVFKHAIATIEITNEPKGFTIGR